MKWGIKRASKSSFEKANSAITKIDKQNSKLQSKVDSLTSKSAKKEERANRFENKAAITRAKSHTEIGYGSSRKSNEKSLKARSKAIKFNKKNRQNQ